MYIDQIINDIKYLQLKSKCDFAHIEFDFDGIPLAFSRCFTLSHIEPPYHMELVKKSDQGPFRMSNLVEELNGRYSYDNRMQFVISTKVDYRMLSDRVYLKDCYYDTEKGVTIMSFTASPVESERILSRLGKTDTSAQNEATCANAGELFPWEIPDSYHIRGGSYSSVMKIEELIDVLRGIQSEAGNESVKVGMGLTQIYTPMGRDGYYGDSREQRHVLCFGGIAYNKRFGEARILLEPSSEIFSIPANVFVDKLKSLAAQGCHTVLLDTKTNAIKIKIISGSVIIFEKATADNKNMHGIRLSSPKKRIKKPDDYFMCRSHSAYGLSDIDEMIEEFADPLLACLAFAPLYLFGLGVGLYGVHWGVFTITIIGAFLGMRAWAIVASRPPGYYTRPWEHGR